ncbi:fluoride efflux transporter CrcB [Lampropedia puyangensis]|uniref:Fluoride-specific ion channel FluC n=1 Tax=Lampropedia puyangensis TaxID=1330072 RepID=A0A4S8EXM9_9BURK|nr:fluoride efflux transporter CrcB [Lampropedia puyangensis]THT99657.1 fluoride efflux transporter CrcB [Lampropedia puyangensis]
MSIPITFTGVALVAIGGAFGSVARYAISGTVTQWLQTIAPATRFPWHTWSINLLGCLIMGVMAGFALRHDWLNQSMRLLLMTGLMGGFTTFSAFGLEALDLVLQKHWSTALAYTLSSVVLGVLAVAIGLFLSSGSLSLQR